MDIRMKAKGEIYTNRCFTLKAVEKPWRKKYPAMINNATIRVTPGISGPLKGNTIVNGTRNAKVSRENFDLSRIDLKTGSIKTIRITKGMA